MNFKGIYDSASEKDIFLVNTTRNMAKPKIISKVFGITMRNLNDKEISSLASFINFDLSKLFEFSSNKTRLVLSIFIILPLMNIGFVLQILQIKSSLCFNDFSKGNSCLINLIINTIPSLGWFLCTSKLYGSSRHKKINLAIDIYISKSEKFEQIRQWRESNEEENRNISCNRHSRHCFGSERKVSFAGLFERFAKRRNDRYRCRIVRLWDCEMVRRSVGRKKSRFDENQWDWGKRWAQSAHSQQSAGNIRRDTALAADGRCLGMYFFRRTHMDCSYSCKRFPAENNPWLYFDGILPA